MWKAGPIYVFPSEGLQTHLSLNVQTASEETVYGCFFNYPLEAGKPYRFVSTGDGEISLEGNNQIAGWTPEVSEEFPFENMTEEGEWEEPDAPDGGEGTEGNEDEDDGQDTEEDTDVIVSEVLPESETIWGPFFVWKVESLSGNEVMATLVSPRQWLLKKRKPYLFARLMKKMEYRAGELLPQKKPKNSATSMMIRLSHLAICCRKTDWIVSISMIAAICAMTLIPPFASIILKL